MLLGGLANGRVGVWDLTAGNGSFSQGSGSLEGSALRLVGLEWAEAATLSGFLGVSSDGVLGLWGQSAVLDPVLTVQLNNLVLHMRKPLIFLDAQRAGPGIPGFAHRHVPVFRGTEPVLGRLRGRLRVCRRASRQRVLIGRTTFLPLRTHFLHFAQNRGYADAPQCRIPRGAKPPSHRLV